MFKLKNFAFPVDCRSRGDFGSWSEILARFRIRYQGSLRGMLDYLIMERFPQQRVQ